MYTDSAHDLTATAQPPAGLLTRTAGQVRQFICGLHGHDTLLHFEQGRISLLCASCGHESPGWEVKAVNHPRMADNRAHVVQLPLVREQRVA